MVLKTISPGCWVQASLMLFCVASIYAGAHRNHFVLSPLASMSVSHFVSRQYLKNRLIDSIKLCHVDVTGPQVVLYCKVTLTLSSNIIILSLSFFVSGQYLKSG